MKCHKKQKERDYMAMWCDQSNLTKSNAQKLAGTCQIWPNNSNFCKHPHLLPDILL